MEDNRVVLITGCSSGIGFALASMLAKDSESGFKVYATLRNLEKIKELELEANWTLNKTLFIKQLDVTSSEQIENVVDEILENESKIDVLVNNAGFGMFGALETQSADKMRLMFATNVYGPIKLTQKILPLWKKENSGHVIMITSVGGFTGLPFHSTYCASKFALEGYSESLAAECIEHNIKVSIVEPGPVMTNFIENCHMADENEVTALDDKTKQLIKTVREKTSNTIAAMGQKPEDVADYIVNIIKSSQPQLRYQTNKLYSTAIQQKFRDPTGNDIINFFNTLNHE